MHESRDVRALLDAIDEVERALKREFPEVRWSFFEPEQAAFADPA